MFKISNFVFLFAMFFALVILFPSTFAQDSTDDELAALFGDLDDTSTNPSNTNTTMTPTVSNKSATRGYKASDTHTQTTLTANSFVFTTPVVKDSNGDNVLKYTIKYSKNPLSSVPLTEITDKNIQFGSVGNSLSFEMNNLMANTKYYITVVPMMGNSAGVPLSEFSITTTASQAGATQTHGVADLNLANVSYTYEGNNYTVSWTPVDGAEKVQIYLKPAGAGDYIKQPDVNMNAGIYKFTASKKGDYLVKMIPVDTTNNPVGAELIQTIKVNTVSASPSDTPAEEVVKTVPKVGPGLNLMIGLFLFGILIYMLYNSRAVNK